MQKRDADCTAKIDRLRVTAEYFPKASLSVLDGFRRLYDYAKVNNPRKAGYRRVTRYANYGTGTEIEVQYLPLQNWLPNCVITLVANDQTGLLRAEVDAIFEGIENAHLALVEVSIEFPSDGIVNEDFIARHLVVGKARHWQTPKAPGFHYFGSRRSPKFVRCYRKKLT
jgi:hypothetical protein